jgi:hypothetical protein
VFVESSFCGSLDKFIIFHGFSGWMFIRVLKNEDENVTNKLPAVNVLYSVKSQIWAEPKCGQNLGRTQMWAVAI